MADPQAQNSKRQWHSHCLVRLVRRFLRVWCSQWWWARKLHGGTWEEWWVDAGVNAYVWLHEPKKMKIGPMGERPAGCAIWEIDPKPRRVEFHSANTEHGHAKGVDPM